MSTPAEAASPLRHDLTEALRDGYLRRVLLGPGGEPTELGFHRMRLLLAEEAPEHERVVGLRFRGVSAVASQAHSFDEGSGAWRHEGSDWVRELLVAGGVPPLVTSAVLGSEETVKRMVDATDELLWLVGSPLDLGVHRRAPVLFEVAAEGTLPSGAPGRLRLFIAATTLEARDAHGLTSLVEVVDAGQAYRQAWTRYWEGGGSDEAQLEDLRFECLPPREAQLDETDL